MVGHTVLAHCSGCGQLLAITAHPESATRCSNRECKTRPWVYAKDIMGLPIGGLVKLFSIQSKPTGKDSYKE
jgi:hypothetical protein